MIYYILVFKWHYAQRLCGKYTTVLKFSREFYFAVLCQVVSESQQSMHISVWLHCRLKNVLVKIDKCCIVLEFSGDFCVAWLWFITFSVGGGAVANTNFMYLYKHNQVLRVRGPYHRASMSVLSVKMVTAEIMILSSSLFRGTSFERHSIRNSYTQDLVENPQRSVPQ
jgi:hypothetical protein